MPRLPRTRGALMEGDARQRKPLMLVNGKWSADWQPVQATDDKGGFVRQTSSFRNWVTPDGAAGPTGEAGFAAEPGRYHLYAGYDLPLGLAHLDRAKAQGPRGRHFGRHRRAGDDPRRLAFRRLSWRRPRRGQWRNLPARNLYPRRPAYFRPRDDTGPLGPQAPDHRQQ